MLRKRFSRAVIENAPAPGLEVLPETFGISAERRHLSSGLSGSIGGILVAGSECCA